MPNIQLYGGTFSPQQMEIVQQWANDLDNAAAYDEQAALIAKHKGIVITLTRRLVDRADGRGLTVEDLLQVGAMAILKAALEYNPTLAEESTFFVPRVYDALQKAAGARVKTPKPHMVDIQAPLGDDNSLTLADVLGDDTVDVEDTSLKRTDADRYRAALRSMLHTLQPLERTILVLFYDENYSMNEIAGLFGVSREHISNRIGNTIGRLRAAHELAQTLRKSDGYAHRIADPKTKDNPHRNALARQRYAERKAKQQLQPTILETMEQQEAA